MAVVITRLMVRVTALRVEPTRVRTGDAGRHQEAKSHYDFHVPPGMLPCTMRLK